MDKRMNVIVVFSPDRTKLLFCLRRKDPYKGKLNFVGGKIEPGEESDHAARRELEEETGLTPADIDLVHVLDMDSFLCSIHLEAWYGVMKRDVPLREEKNPLLWLPADGSFTDLTRYAGNGSVDYVLHCVNEWLEAQG